MSWYLDLHVKKGRFVDFIRALEKEKSLLVNKEETKSYLEEKDISIPSLGSYRLDKNEGIFTVYFWVDFQSKPLKIKDYEDMMKILNLADEILKPSYFEIFDEHQEPYPIEQNKWSLAYFKKEIIPLMLNDKEAWERWKSRRKEGPK